MLREVSHSLLVVDDERDVLDSLRHLFRREYQVWSAASAAEAIEILKRESIQIILSDQRMPGMRGVEFLTRAREIRPEAVRIMFTGFAEIPAMLSAVNQGEVFRFILKPWEVEELQTVIRQAAEHYDLRAERRKLLEDLQRVNEELREANLELERSNATRSAFLEVASHELNTPITVLQGLAELLRLSDKSREANEQELIERICGSAARLAQLVNTMLQVSSTLNGATDVRWRTCSLDELLAGVIEELRPFATARGLCFHVESFEVFPDWPCDAPRLRDALLHVISNAIKFTPDGGRITIRLSHLEPDSARIQVIDQGIGVDLKDLSQIFEPFHTQRDPGLHHSGRFAFGARGLGLGLFLVKRFVELHHGSVRAESTPGRGTTITIDLPRLGPAVTGHQETRSLTGQLS